ncbi:MAG: hypothetical protein EAY65_03375 [Alphaproteobacteria bacterium]|nr:MAG: hypothetical protein EAY65_03375 [Alphaproteobacteria bacterium]
MTNMPLNHQNEQTKLGILPLQMHNTQTGHQHTNDFIDSLFSWSTGVSAAIAATPLALQQFGIGVSEHVKKLDTGLCCELIQNATKDTPWLQHEHWSKRLDGSTETVYGVAGWASGLLSHVPCGEQMLQLEQALLKKLEVLPFIKEGSADHLDVSIHPLARGGLMNALVAGGIIMMGHFGGKIMDHVHVQRRMQEAQDYGASEETLAQIAQERSALGRITQDASKLLGFGVLIPAILPGVGHALLSLSSTMGIDTYASHMLADGISTNIGEGPATALAAFLGKNPGSCKGTTKLTDALESSLLSQLCCVVPAITAAIPALANVALNQNKTYIYMPEDITPYDAKHHADIPDKEALAHLSEEILLQRYKSNQFHIDNTKASLDATSGLRTMLKTGSALAATVGTVALSQHLMQRDAPSTDTENPQEQLNELKNRITPHGVPATKHDVTTSLTKDHNGSTLKAHIPPYDSSNVDNSPDFISMQTGRDCCPGTVYVRKDNVENYIKATSGEAASEENNPHITTNRTLLSGGVSGLLGAATYKAVEHVVDGASHKKIAQLERENSVIDTILATKNAQKTATHTDRLAQQEAQPLFAQAR